MARETVQFPRNASNAMLRMNLYIYDHNVRKPYRIRQPGGQDDRHVDRAGLVRDRWSSMTFGFLEDRMFKPSWLVLSESAKRSLQRAWKTPLKKHPERCWRYMAA